MLPLFSRKHAVAAHRRTPRHASGTRQRRQNHGTCLRRKCAHYGLGDVDVPGLTGRIMCEMKNSRDDIRQEILRLISEAEALVPARLEPDLPPGKSTAGEPDWHPFEHEVWQIGERIRQLLNACKVLRCDHRLHEAIVRMCQNRAAKRGRQSFILLLGYSCCDYLAYAISSELGDSGVQGHVVHTLLKMRVAGFFTRVEPLTRSRFAWIRNKANTYCERYPQTSNSRPAT